MATPPKGAKKPADRKPKVIVPGPDAEDTPGVRVVTVGDTHWTIPEDALDDFELLDDLGALEDGNAARLPRIMRRLLGDDYKKALDVIRDESGVVRIEPAAEFIQELLGGLNPN